MGMKSYTIGELARLSGQSVRRIRFYSDRGLLPPVDRAAGNYRLYAETDVAKLDLIRALRDAGVGLEAIGKVLQRELSLSALLQARLGILESEIAAKHRTAAVLRATLQIPEPTEDDLRRLWAMSTLSNTQMRRLIEDVVNTIAVSAQIDEAWRHRMLETGVPEMPDDPTPEQISAWNELAAMLEDETFAEELKAQMEAFWTGALDPAAYRNASIKAYEAAQEALGRRLSPHSTEGANIARAWLEESAKAMGREPGARFADWLFGQYAQQDGRVGRYHALIAILRGEEGDTPAAREWTWLNAATQALYPKAG